LLVFGRGMPPGVLEPRAGGCIAALGVKNKETAEIELEAAGPD
jgi:hypothetical protein